jgi:hypothetical protein
MCPNTKNKAKPIWISRFVLAFCCA